MKKTDQIRLSVVIPCYNHGQYLMEALQCFPDYHDQNQYEIIIVNDGSTDEVTLESLQKAEALGFKVLHQDNQGLSSARNNGIKNSVGDYILPLDSDDQISVELIYESIDILDNYPEYSVVYSNGNYFGAKEGPWIIGEFNLQRLMLWNYMHAAAVFRRSAWEQAGGYDINLNHLGFEDWDLWLSIAFSGGKFYYLNKNLFSYRITAGSMVARFTGAQYKLMQDYINQKHSAYLSNDHLTKHVVLMMKQNKLLWFKLFMRVYFPNFLAKLVKKGKIDSDNVFY